MFILVAFNAVIPLMTVVNYSVQETFGNNLFFWQGIDWFEKVVNSERFYNALGRQFLYTGIILFIEIPLGIAIALTMPKKRNRCLILFSFDVHTTFNTLECCRRNVEYICPS